MAKLENSFAYDSLIGSKPLLVPHIFTKNYFNILIKKIQGEKLTTNERYYYNHFIKKKLQAMVELFRVDMKISGKDQMIPSRITEALKVLGRYQRKHRNKKILISGSFLYQKEYKDIDLFVLSRYSKEDYREGEVHVNFLPYDAEKTLFFHSISKISISNFQIRTKIEENTKLNDILMGYELVILLIIQDDDFVQSLRELILRLEYYSGGIIIDSKQLKTIIGNIISSKKIIKVINKYLVAKIINSEDIEILRKTLRKFIKKNSSPEKGRKMYENWIIYNQTYNEALEIVA